MQSLDSDRSQIVELSVSAWFYRNRTVAGFDNPARSLYMSVRELVENSLDACETAGVTPSVSVSLSLAAGQEPQSSDFAGAPMIYRLTVQDNGSGMSRENLPRLIGRMLSGTKFQHRQSRGTFGLGGSLALLYGQATTQEPIEVTTGQVGEDQLRRVLLRLDIDNNTPVIIEESFIPKDTSDHGTRISYCLQGDWLRSKKRIADYFLQTSIIVPYAYMRLQSPEGELHTYEPVVDSLPPEPKTVKPHPRGIDSEMLKKIISTSKKKTLKAFMLSSFQRVGESTADAFLSDAGLDPDRSPNDLGDQEMVKMAHHMAQFRGFLPPSSDSLSPAGIDVIEAGLRRMLPDLVVARQRPPSVYEGHSFIVETAVAYGGSLERGVHLLRFANRIPLLYDEGSDVSSKVLRTLNLKQYGLQEDDPLLFLMHLCSTRVPFKSVGKEHIGDVDEVRKEIDLGFKDCLRRLSETVRRQNQSHRTKKREDRLLEYYSFISDTLRTSTGRDVKLSGLFPEGEANDL